MKRLSYLITALSVLGLVSAVEANAQTNPPEGFSLNRFEPSERGSEWFVLDSLDFRGAARPAVGAVVDYGHKPLVFFGPDGNEVRAVVSDQVFAHVGTSVAIWDQLRLAIDLPIALANQGQARDPGDPVDANAIALDEGAGIGDIRLGADWLLFGGYDEAVRGALGLQAYIPTGDQESFTSDGKVRLLPHFLVAGDIGQLSYGGRAAFQWRAKNDNFNGEPFGSEVTFGASIGVRFLERRLLVGPEVYGSTVVSDGGDGFFSKKTTPVEGVLGAHYLAGDSWRIGLGAGPGLTRGLGSPELRVLASLEWVQAVETDRDQDGIFDAVDACPDVPGLASEDPAMHGCPLLPPPVLDRDKDGIVDGVDACPDVPGVASEDPSKHGCPPPTDRDGDGIFDDVDACPDVPGVASEDPSKHGCPPPTDRDGDGIFDDVDACPDVPGVASEEPAKHGCPPSLDPDGDGILNPDDACPEVAGVASKDPKKHGCPKVKIEKGEIKILEQVRFATASAKILKKSEGILEAVATILKDHAEILSLNVEGHTDSEGGASYNLRLSNRRAASVVTWLVAHGVKRERLTSQGLGLERPIDTNDTPAGRQNNRRVEFHITKSSESSTELRSE